MPGSTADGTTSPEQEHLPEPGPWTLPQGLESGAEASWLAQVAREALAGRSG
ncbi:MAG: hypothetical protein RL653_4092 [Pseudomonadota bacterium]|jgi:hypothetical protein